MAFDPSTATTTFGFQDGFQTTLSAGITASDTVIPLTLLPTPTESTIVVEPGTANEEEIYFTTSGSGVVNAPSVSAGRGVNGTAVAHNSGVAVKMLFTKAMADVLKNGAALSGGLDKLAGNEAWTNFNSTVTGFSVITQMIKYQKVGRSVNMQVQIDGTSNTTDFTFTLPFQPTIAMYRAGFWGRDNSLNLGSGALILTSSTTTVITVYSNPGLGVWTAANTKSLEGSFTYEATT